MLEKIRITVKNEKEQKRVESSHRQKLGKTFSELLIDKVVAELTNIMAAKSVQTAANVAKFQTMKTEDKFAEISPSLIKDDCAICGTNTQVFSTVSIPVKLLLQMKLSGIPKTIKGRKKTIETVWLNIGTMKQALEEFPPKLHFMKFCSDCGSKVLEQAHLPDDPQYGITKIIPQNQANNQVEHRLMLLPLVDPSKTVDGFQPNDPQLSFARQWMRGFISATVGVPPAERDCLLGSLMFLTALATNKENSTILFANQKSLLSGGANNNYSSTVGRLFAPTSKSISGDTLMLISLVQDVIDMAEIPILPESNKLLLLCLLEKRVLVLINARNRKQNTINLLDNILQTIISGSDNPNNDFGITQEDIQNIKNFATVQEFKDANQESVSKFIAAHLQNVNRLDIGHVQKQEKALMGALAATNVDEIGDALNIQVDHLSKMITRSNLTPESFIELTGKVLNEFATSNEKYTDILMKFV
jgi:hypothetical protein